MKFVLVNDQRHEAAPGLSGRCLSCDQAMVSKCGNVKVWHWAHKGRRMCDLWWENETEWHVTNCGGVLVTTAKFVINFTDTCFAEK